MNLETQKHTKRIEIHQSQITNRDLLSPLKLFPKRAVKMIDGSKNTIIQNAELNGTLLKSWLLESITLWATLLNYGKCSLPIIAMRSKI